jgi:membrane protease YdiL (CAAX protease family)
MSIPVFIKRHPLLTYFVVAFAISWGGILLAICLFGGMPANKEQFDMQLPSAIPAMLGGPSVAGILLIGLVNGKAGYRELKSRFLRWRVGVRWYAIAILTGPLVLMATLVTLSLISPVFLPGIFASDNKVPLLLSGIIGGVTVGIFEELGWTGFAVPRLRLRYSILTTGLIVGVLWGGWHILSNVIWGSGAYAGSLSPALYITVHGFIFLIGQLPAFRVLLVWVYDRTSSLLVVMLMHAGLTVSTLILGPLAISGVSLLIYDLATAAVMWVVVAAVAVANGWLHSRQPLGSMEKVK